LIYGINSIGCNVERIIKKFNSEDYKDLQTYSCFNVSNVVLLIIVILIIVIRISIYIYIYIII